MTMPNTYRMPARSVGIGATIRRRTPAGALIDHVIDRIEHRPGDEVRIDLVDPANGWGAFLVLDGSDEVDVVDPPATNYDEPVDVEVVDDDGLGPYFDGDHEPLADPDADPREMCLEDTIAGKCARWADHDGGHRVRFLTTAPHDGHPAWERCPACPHEPAEGKWTP